MFLEIDSLAMQFGGLSALRNVSMRIEEGEIHGLIGPNGSGKTTTFNVVSGYYKPSGGRIIFRKKDITGQPAYKITATGFARTFQNLRLFKSMTVLENVLVGMGHHAKTGLWQEFINPIAVRREEKGFIEKAMKLLELLGIANLADYPATSLSYGHQRRVEIARALGTDPTILLLDEPAAGLNDVESENLRQTLVRVRASGVTIFLIEHDMKLVMGMCDIITVLDYGRKIAEGSCDRVSNDPVVIEAYLGKEERL